MKLSRKKKLAFSALALIVFFVALEACLHVGYLALRRARFPFDEYQNAIVREATTGVLDGRTGKIRYEAAVEVIHPYLGFVHDPNQNPNTSPLGFPLAPAATQASSEALTVGIFGGSFACGVAMDGKLDAKLKELGIEAKVMNVAMGGYKQPQQLLALTYLLSQGTNIDVVVNIDGFNEVTLPAAENLPKGTNPFYPRAWATRSTDVEDTESMKEIGRIAVLRDTRRWWAGVFLRFPKYSIVRDLAWRARDLKLGSELSNLNKQLSESRPKSARFLANGPAFAGPLIPQLAGHWAACSLMMKNLCDSRGIKYIHAIQPNQYVEGSRVFTPEEKAQAFKADHPYRPSVEEGYSKLLQAGRGLVDRGVDFHDMTMVYRDLPDPIYQDDCCHPNPRGYEIIAELLAPRIAARLRNENQLP